MSPRSTVRRDALPAPRRCRKYAGRSRYQNEYHFAYADGTPYFPFGTTCYAWVHQSEQMQEQTLKTLASAPFNKMRMCVFPKHYEYNHNEPALYPFVRDAAGKHDFARFNPGFFAHIEKRIGDLSALGIEADLILFHPYDRWGYQSMTAEEDDRYLKYVWHACPHSGISGGRWPTSSI